MNRESLKLIGKIAIPILIGIAVVAWLFGNEFNLSDIKQIEFTSTTAIGLGTALLFTFGRDFGMAWRFRSLTDEKLRWKAAAKVTMLCEFTSTITPTSAGGSALSMIFICREGISLGRSTAITVCTLFLDELFFVIFFPLLFLLVDSSTLFGFTDGAGAHKLQVAFWIVYGILVIITAALFLGLFFIPNKIANGLVKMFSIKLLRRWRKNVIELGENLIETSNQLRHKSAKWWIKPVSATIITWLSRFLVVNALFFAFFPDSNPLIIFARQLVVWALLLFMPTPGGSGLSEVLFKTYYSDIVTGPLMMILAITWRILTYYIFLLIGFCMIPTFLNLKKIQNKHE
jgi:hypothetical protein